MKLGSWAGTGRLLSMKVVSQWKAIVNARCVAMEGFSQRKFFRNERLLSREVQSQWKAFVSGGSVVVEGFRHGRFCRNGRLL